MKSIFHSLTVILTALVTLCSASAAEKLEVLFIEDFPPYYFVDQNNQPAGVVTELAQEILALSGLEYTLEPTNINRLEMIIRKGGNVAAIGAYKTRERESWSITTGEIYRFPQPVLVIKKHSRAKLPDKVGFAAILDAVNNKQINGILIENYSYGPWADINIARYLDAVPRQILSMEQALKMVASRHRADFTLAYPAQISSVSKQDGKFAEKVNFIELDNAPPENGGNFWLFSKSCDPTVIAIIEKATAEFKKTERYHEILAKLLPHSL